MRYPLFVSLVIWLGWCSPLRSQVIGVYSDVSSDSMMIGDQLLYRVKVDAATEVEFNMPALRDSLGSGFEILRRLAADTSTTGRRRVVEHQYLFTGFDGGSHTIPPQKVVYELDGISDTALGTALMVNVFEPEVDTAKQIRPIKPPINTPLTFAELLPWIAGGAAGWLVLTLIAALIWMARQRRKDPDIFAVRPEEPAHVIAFRELDLLKQEKLWERGEVKRFYTRLTDITRHYIERQYGIPAMERTTEEILTAFRRSNMEDGILDEMLEELLRLADLVKFAKEDPLPLDNQTNLNNAYIFVQKTYPLFYMEKSETGEEVTDEPD